jgi:hypothetical protein
MPVCQYLIPDLNYSNKKYLHSFSGPVIQAHRPVQSNFPEIEWWLPFVPFNFPPPVFQNLNVGFSDLCCTFYIRPKFPCPKINEKTFLGSQRGRVGNTLSCRLEGPQFKSQQTKLQIFLHFLGLWTLLEPEKGVWNMVFWSVLPVCKISIT